MRCVIKKGWVKSRKFGQLIKFGQQPCFFHIFITGIKDKLTKQTVKILIRRLRAVSSAFSLYAIVCVNLPVVRSYLT